MLHIGLAEFLIFGLYFILWKFLIHFINVQARQAGSHTLAGVSGLLA